MGTPALELTREEIIERISAGATQRLGMNFIDFLSAWHTGRLEDPGRVADLLALARLLRDDDPLLILAAGRK